MRGFCNLKQELMKIFINKNPVQINFKLYVKLVFKNHLNLNQFQIRHSKFQIYNFQIQNPKSKISNPKISSLSSCFSAGYGKKQEGGMFLWYRYPYRIGYQSYYIHVYHKYGIIFSRFRQVISQLGTVVRVRGLGTESKKCKFGFTASS